jgi:ABC-type glutathione transport system ATPase component
MAFIIGLCGTHGTGKSTILQGVKAAGIAAKEVQLSRQAQTALGWDKLSRAEESEEMMWQLQDAILAAMYDRDQEIKETKTLTIVERTPADVWAYTLMWLTRLHIDPHTNKKAQEYKGQCRDMAWHYAKFLMVQPSDLVPFAEEPMRADAKSRASVAFFIDDFLFSGCLPTYIFKTSAREERVKEALASIAFI